jgi:hypothetical protein
MLRLRRRRNEDFRLRLPGDSWRDEVDGRLRAKLLLRGKTGRDHEGVDCP